MYRVTVASPQTYAIEIDIEVDEDVKDIIELVTSGDVVILCDSLDDLTDYGISIHEVKLLHK